MEEKKFKRTTVTAALPYANGGVHIGHLAGVYVPADIYVRYLRLKNREVAFICGSDEHGVLSPSVQRRKVSPHKTYVTAIISSLKTRLRSLVSPSTSTVALQVRRTISSLQTSSVSYTTMASSLNRRVSSTMMRRLTSSLPTAISWVSVLTVVIQMHTAINVRSVAAT